MMAWEQRGREAMAQSSPIGWGAVARPPRVNLKRPVDLDHLARQTAGDPQVEREALQLFVIQAALYLDRLRMSAGRDRVDAAHTLKGSAAAVGAWGVAELAEQLEQMGRGGSGRGVRSLLSDLESELEDVGSFVGRLYTEH